jgi:hypothetical protein
MVQALIPKRPAMVATLGMEFTTMNRSDSLRNILVRAERYAPDDALDELAWMLAGFARNHAVRQQAHDLPKLQKKISTQLRCTTDIGAVMRVMTNRGNAGLVGAAAEIIHGQLRAQ